MQYLSLKGIIGVRAQLSQPRRKSFLLTGAGRCLVDPNNFFLCGLILRELVGTGSVIISHNPLCL